MQAARRRWPPTPSRMRARVWQGIHDRAVDRVSGIIDIAVKLVGEHALGELWDFLMSDWYDVHAHRYALDNQRWSDSAHQLMIAIVDGFHAHLTGAGRQGDIDRHRGAHSHRIPLRAVRIGWTISGCHHHRGLSTCRCPLRFAVTTERHDWAWNTIGICSYCVHCCQLNEVMPIDRLRLPDPGDRPAGLVALAARRRRVRGGSTATPPTCPTTSTTESAAIPHEGRASDTGEGAAMSDSVAMTQLEVPDYDLGLRGKLVRSRKTRGTSSLAFCTIIYGLSLADDVTDTPLSNAANGYPDAALIPDESTRVALPWRCGTDAVIADLAGADGVPLAVSPRLPAVGADGVTRTSTWTPSLATSTRLWIFDRTPGSHWRRPPPARPRRERLQPVPVRRNTALPSNSPIACSRSASRIEAFHSELGPGFFEFTLAPAPAVRAADNAVRARQYLRDLCHERGLHASFMAKPFADKSGAGGHVHSSLNRDGTNVFADDRASAVHRGAALPRRVGLRHARPRAAAESVRQLLQAHRPGDVHRRPRQWGHDDRSTACRVLLADRSSARVEHRRPGADANPYIVAAALLAGGLHGLREHLPLPEPREPSLPCQPISAAPLPLRTTRRGWPICSARCSVPPSPPPAAPNSPHTRSGCTARSPLGNSADTWSTNDRHHPHSWISTSSTNSVGPGEINTVVCATPDPYGRLVGKRLTVQAFRALGL